MKATSLQELPGKCLQKILEHGAVVDSQSGQLKNSCYNAGDRVRFLEILTVYYSGNRTVKSVKATVNSIFVE